MTQKTVAIIGAGMAGLTAAQSFKVRGFNVVNFEKNEESGGLWHPKFGAAGPETTANISKYQMVNPRFPWKARTPDFPNTHQIWRYLNDFKYHYGLEDEIYYGHQVTSVRFQKKDKQYRLQLNNKDDFQADFVVNANGMFHDRHIPRILRKGKCQTPVVHSGEIKNYQDYAGKTVIVVGGGMSGIESSSHFANHGAKVMNVANRNCWIVKRTINGVPFDMLSYNYPSKAGTGLSGKEMHQRRVSFIESTFGNPGEAHPALRMDKNSDEPFSVAVADHYLDQVKEGLVTPYRHDPVSHLSKNGLVLASGVELNADLIVAATGYSSNFTFFENNILADMWYDRWNRFQPALLPDATLTMNYKGLFHVGASIRGSYRLDDFLQSEYAASLAAQEISYPSKKVMQEAFQKELDIRNQRPQPQFPQNYMAHTLKLAERIGALPRDLLEQAEKSKVPMCPADFLRFGPHADPQFAEEQRGLYLQRLNCND